MEKRGFEFSFGWMFAIIVGAIIIFFAIYATTKLINTERVAQDSEIAKQIGILLNPLENNLEDQKVARITTPTETRIFFGCNTRGNFGAQEISVATRSDIGREWQEPANINTFYNKYVFSKGVVEGKNFPVFSQTFYMPYKIADVIYLWSDEDNYCFVNPPNDIEKDIITLNLDSAQNKLNISSSENDCPKPSTKVCFGNGRCDVNVFLDSKSVRKNQQTLYYDDTFGSALLYGAIFADPGIYECQVKRLMQRTSEISSLEYSKSEFLTSRGCTSNLGRNLIAFANLTQNINNSRQLNSISMNAEEIRRANDVLSCKLF